MNHYITADLINLNCDMLVEQYQVPFRSSEVFPEGAASGLEGSCHVFVDPSESPAPANIG